jgi:3-oxoacyl-[acyl-carrier protein] reductase
MMMCMCNINSGIGAAIALTLARDGARVAVNYNNDKKSADAVVAAINSVHHDAAFAVHGDVSKSADVDRLFAETKTKFGGIDIVVANSGLFIPPATFAETTNEQLDKVFDINVKGTFYTLRAAAQHIRDHGRIIINGSISKRGTVPGYGTLTFLHTSSHEHIQQ